MTRFLWSAAGAVAGLLALVPQPGAAQDADPTPIVELMRAGAGPGTHRPNGAKGACYQGEFRPAAGARDLSRAVIFTRNSPAVIRFSVGGGNPAVADGARGVNRGLSFRIDGDGPGQTEFVMINAPINFARTPAQMQASSKRAGPAPTANRTRSASAPSPRPTPKPSPRRAISPPGRSPAPGWASPTTASTPTRSPTRPARSASSSSGWTLSTDR